MKKYLKIFVVCLCLVAVLTVSCFATSVHTTSTTAAYGHYISPGEYVFNNILDFANLTGDVSIRFNFFSNGFEFKSIYIYFSPGDVSYFFSNPVDSQQVLVYNDNWNLQAYRTIVLSDGFFIYDPLIYSWWQSNVTRVSPGYDSNLLDGFFSSFTIIGQFISGAANTLTSMFWSNNSLTFLGTLAVSALAFAVAFLIIGLISRFLRFRG